MHDHKVEDTRKRSILKALSARLIEITVGTTIQGLILHKLFQYLGLAIPLNETLVLGFVMTLVEEVVCFTICYFNDRAWNRIQWGRIVKEIKPPTKEELEEMELWDKASSEDWAKFVEREEMKGEEIKPEEVKGEEA